MQDTQSKLTITNELRVTIRSEHKPTEVGSIPQEWEIKQLGDIASITAGGTPSRGNPSYWDGDIPWVTTAQIDFNTITIADQFITEAGLQSSSAKVFPAGTLLMALYGQGKTRGKIAILGMDASTNQACAAITLDRGVSGDYVFHFLASRYDAIRNLSNGGSQENLNGRIVRSIPILLPPLPEQRRIADILGTWDRAIETTEKLIDACERRKRGLMQQLLSGKRRVQGFVEEWKTVGAGMLFKNVSIKGSRDEELLSATQDRGIIPRRMLEARVTMPSGDTGEFKLVEKGDFVISLRSFQGGLEYSHYRGLVSPAYNVLKPKQPIHDEFYKHYFKSYDFIGHLAGAVIGIRDGKQISFGDFCMVTIPHPSIEEQHAIASVLSTCDTELDLLHREHSALQQQKKGLMQQLLTGRIRVPLDA